MIKSLVLDNLTVFEHLRFSPSPGITAIIGENGTGKTHLLKFAYSVLRGPGRRSYGAGDLPETLDGVFVLAPGAISTLFRKEREAARITLATDVHTFEVPLENLSTERRPDPFPEQVMDLVGRSYVYIPPKEVLGQAPGLRALFNQRNLHLESLYIDLLDWAFLPPLREHRVTPGLQEIYQELTEFIGGEVSTSDETFYLQSGRKRIDFNLVAEGWRKLALLAVLIQNVPWQRNDILFWDEPETNLNPTALPLIARALFALKAQGVQIIVATHSFVFLKELELLSSGEEDVLFGSLYKPRRNAGVLLETSASLSSIEHNAIERQNLSLYRKLMQKSMTGQT